MYGMIAILVDVSTVKEVAIAAPIVRAPDAPSTMSLSRGAKRAVSTPAMRSAIAAALARQAPPPAFRPRPAAIAKAKFENPFAR
jgi:hypothetical protein